MTTIRPANPQDVSAVFSLIKELALYEKAPEQVTNTEQNLACDLFEDPICEAIVAEAQHTIIGFALYYTSYSTWKGRCLYLEDFYVRKQHRNTGVGQLLFDEVVHNAKEKQVARMDWQVLEWNALAIAFYKKNKSTFDPEWINGRLLFDYK